MRNLASAELNWTDGWLATTCREIHVGFPRVSLSFPPSLFLSPFSMRLRRFFFVLFFFFCCYYYFFTFRLYGDRFSRRTLLFCYSP